MILKWSWMKFLKASGSAKVAQVAGKPRLMHLQCFALLSFSFLLGRGGEALPGIPFCTPTHPHTHTKLARRALADSKHPSETNLAVKMKKGDLEIVASRVSNG